VYKQDEQKAHRDSHTHTHTHIEDHKPENCRLPAWLGILSEIYQSSEQQQEVWSQRRITGGAWVICQGRKLSFLWNQHICYGGRSISLSLLQDDTNGRRGRVFTWAQQWKHASMRCNCLSMIVTTAVEDTLHKSRTTSMVSFNWMCKLGALLELLNNPQLEQTESSTATQRDSDLIFVAFDFWLLWVDHVCLSTKVL